MIVSKSEYVIIKYVKREQNNELYKKRNVLDKGFVRLVDYMGSDARIVQSARVSYGEGTKTFREDKSLIRYLLRNAHTSPFEQVVFTFHVKMPIFVARQWARHRTARLNEISARYSEMKNEFYVPDSEDVNFQSKENKQNRDMSDTHISRDLQKEVCEVFVRGQAQSYEDYHALLEKNIAREIARIALPTSLYTEMYWQIDLHNLFHFLKLRMDAHAQKEIQSYATVLFAVAKEICPLACEAFEDYVLGKVEFYAFELEALGRMLQIKNAQPALDVNAMETIAEASGITNTKERTRFVQKISAIQSAIQAEIQENTS